MKRSRAWRRVLTIAACLALAGLSHPCLAYTPESPEVKSLIQKALGYLANAGDTRLGGSCLVGLAFVKNGADETHPRVSDAVEDCQEYLQGNVNLSEHEIYSTGLAIIFLCELDAEKYTPEITQLLDKLKKSQREAGGWGYPLELKRHGDKGDTSMTQYGVLSSWTATRHGIPVSREESIVPVCNWLLRTQDPQGGWGYQGEDPGEGKYERIKQHDVRVSLTAAGLGSVYICADLLGLSPGAEKDNDELPPALKLVKVQLPLDKASVKKVDLRALRKAEVDGNRWFNENYKIDPEQWTHYYLYALERYKSFREWAEGTAEKEPKWYNEGVEYLAKTQDPKGSWSGNGGATVDTAFGVLFLMRSTRKSIEKAGRPYGDSTLRGGRGLPTDTTQVRVSQGRIVSKPLAGKADDLLTVLSDPDHPDFDYLSSFPGEFSFSAQAELRAAQIDRMRRLLVDGPVDARRAAVRLLARQRNLEHVPLLILALADTDLEAARQAHDGLRFVSRHLHEGPLPQPLSSDQRAAIIERWKKWYLSIHPEAELLN